MPKTPEEEVESIRLLSINAKTLSAEIEIARWEIAKSESYDIQRLLKLLDEAFPLYCVALDQTVILLEQMLQFKTDHPSSAPENVA